jgi:hypothetical protein
MPQTPLLPRMDEEVAVPEFTEQLLDALRHAHPVPPAQAARKPSRRWPRVVVACTIAVAALALLAPRLHDAPPGVVVGPPAANAADVLRSAAKAAERQSRLAPGEYLRVRMLRTDRTGSAVSRSLWTSWMAPSGRARFLVEPLGGAAFARTDIRCTAAGCVIRDGASRPEAAPPARYGPGFTARQLRQLPAKPSALLRAIERRAAHANDPNGYRGDPWEGGFSLLVAPIQPQVRAALYRALASLPGVHVLGREVIGGRRGIALERRVPASPGGAPAGWRVIVVDPRTGELLAARGYLGHHRLSDRRVYHSPVVGSLAG